jgi:hypothetical protein
VATKEEVAEKLKVLGITNTEGIAALLQQGKDDTGVVIDINMKISRIAKLMLTSVHPDAIKKNMKRDPTTAEKTKLEEISAARDFLKEVAPAELISHLKSLSTSAAKQAAKPTSTNTASTRNATTKQRPLAPKGPQTEEDLNEAIKMLELRKKYNEALAKNNGAMVALPITFGFAFIKAALDATICSIGLVIDCIDKLSLGALQLTKISTRLYSAASTLTTFLGTNIALLGMPSIAYNQADQARSLLTNTTNNISGAIENGGKGVINYLGSSNKSLRDEVKQLRAAAENNAPLLLKNEPENPNHSP